MLGDADEECADCSKKNIFPGISLAGIDGNKCMEEVISLGMCNLNILGNNESALLAQQPQIKYIVILDDKQ